MNMAFDDLLVHLAGHQIKSERGSGSCSPSFLRHCSGGRVHPGRHFAFSASHTLAPSDYISEPNPIPEWEQGLRQ